MSDSHAMVCCPSMASMVGHLVSQVLTPASDMAAAMSAGCGRSSCAWLAKYDRAGVWRRIRSGFSQLTIDGHGEPFSDRWSRWAIVVDGAYGALLMWERLTAARASSCSAIVNQQWPTPTAIDEGSGRINRSDSPHAATRPTLAWMARTAGWPASQARDSRTGSPFDSLRTHRQAARGWSPNESDVVRWPTPRVEEREQTNSQDNVMALSRAVQVWPTPKADNANGGRNLKPDRTTYQSDGTSGPTLVDAVTLWPTARADSIDGHASVGYSPALHQTVKMWPTSKVGNANGAGLHGEGSPDLQTLVTRWPTPQTRDWKNGQASDKTLSRHARPLNERVIQSEEPAQQQQNPMYLNAAWVEALMNFPPGWTIPAGPPGREKRQRPGSRRAPSHGA